MVPYKASLYCGLAKVLLSFLLVPMLGLNVEAWLLSIFFLISISVIVLRGIKEINARVQLGQSEAPS